MTTYLVLTAFAASAMIAAIALARTAPIAPNAASPALDAHRSNDHAVRILVGRYARGEITVDEYRRMLIMLKH